MYKKHNSKSKVMIVAACVGIASVIVFSKSAGGNAIKVMMHTPEKQQWHGTVTPKDTTAVDVKAGVLSTSDDLVYREYGDDVIEADASMVFVIDEFPSMKEDTEIENILIYDYQRNTYEKIPIDEEQIRYEVPHGGVYKVYLQMNDGSQVDLTNYVLVEAAGEKAGDNLYKKL